MLLRTAHPETELGATPGAILTKTPLLKSEIKHHCCCRPAPDVFGPESVQKLCHSCLQARHLHHHPCPQIHLSALSLCTRDSSYIQVCVDLSGQGPVTVLQGSLGEMYYFCFCFGNVYQLEFSREAESIGYIRLAKKFVHIFWYHLMETSK